jgi:DNA repair exonuclease SbcCD ATPase subunit
MGRNQKNSGGRLMAHSLDFYKRTLNNAKGQESILVQQLGERQQAAVSHKSLLDSTEKAQVILQKVAKDTQEKLRYHIEDIVQLALDTCFPDEYEFQVNFEIKRGKTEAKMFFLKDGREVDPMDAAGGGVVDLAAFALRIAAWSLGNTRNVIVLDEPFRFLSKDLQPKAGEILRQLSKRLKLQVLMVTHNTDMIDISDLVFDVRLKDGVSNVTVKDL